MMAFDEQKEKAEHFNNNSDEKTKIKLIFLDVDGVLNTSGSIGSYPLDSDKLDLLNMIVVQTNAKIVISSSWREVDDAMNVLKKEFNKKDIDCIIGITPSLHWDSKRTDQIKHFVENFSKKYKNQIIDKWIAIDDFKLDEMNPNLMKNHFVNTQLEIGMTKNDAETAIKLLS